MTDFFGNVRARRTVFKRTRPGPDLPAAALYLEWLSRERKRKVLDPDGAEHLLADTVIQSHYKIVSKSESKKLIEAHWKDEVAAAQTPLRKSE